MTHAEEEVDTSALWQQARTGDAAARAALIEAHRELVDRIVGRMSLRATAVTDKEDLASAGTLGLIDAVDRFDPERGVPFEGYAARRIRGAILDELRRLDLRGSGTRRQARAVRATAEAIEAESGHAPSAAELSAATELDARHVEVALAAYSCMTVSLDRLVSSGVQGGWILADDPTTPVLERDTIDDVRSAVRELPERERAVLDRYYGEALTLREIGALMGISEARVCQLHAQAISHIRRSLFTGAHPLPATA